MGPFCGFQLGRDLLSEVAEAGRALALDRRLGKVPEQLLDVVPEVVADLLHELRDRRAVILHRLAMLVDPALPLSELPDNPDNSDEKSKSANNCGDGQRGFKPLTHGFPEYGSALRGRQRPVGAAGESASVPSGEIVSIKELHGRSRSSGQNGLGDSECHRARVAPRRPAEGRTRPRRARPPPAVRQLLRRTPASSWVNRRICRWIVPLFRSTYCVPISASSGPARAVSRSAVCSASCPASTCTKQDSPFAGRWFTPPGRGRSRPHSSSPRKGAGRLRVPGDDNARVVRGCGMTLRPLHIKREISYLTLYNGEYEETRWSLA